MTRLMTLINDDIDNHGESKAAGIRRLSGATSIPVPTLRNWIHGCRAGVLPNERVSKVLAAIGILPGTSEHREVWQELGVAL